MFAKEQGGHISRMETAREICTRTGQDFAEFTSMPEWDASVGILWEKYIRIRKGCEAIGYQELVNYSVISGEDIEPWEADLLIEIDRIGDDEWQ
jgi:hypothetical protein